MGRLALVPAGACQQAQRIHLKTWKQGARFFLHQARHVYRIIRKIFLAPIEHARFPMDV